jgi:hypothetical protein
MYKIVFFHFFLGALGPAISSNFLFNSSSLVSSSWSISSWRFLIFSLIMALSSGSSSKSASSSFYYSAGSRFCVFS